MNTDGAPAASTTHAASATPIDCPKNSADANVETAVPRAAGTICVAFVCSVLWSMKNPSPSANIAGSAQ